MGFFSISKLLKKDNNQVNYLSLVITSDRVSALIWTFLDGKVQELGFAQKTLSSVEFLLHQSAVAIDAAAEAAGVDCQKTVFGLSSDWMEEEQLSQKSSKILKKLSDELDLVPQAFVPLAASVNHLVKIEKFPAPQFIAIGIFGQRTKQAFCELSTVVKDKVVNSATTQLPITEQKLERLVEELKGDGELPARIVIYGIDESEDFAAKIKKIDWGRLFLHEPKLEFLNDRALARSVAYAQAADLLGHEPLNLAQISDSTKPAKINQFGFIEGEDILRSKDDDLDPDEDKEDEPTPEAPKPALASTPTKSSDEITAVPFTDQPYAVDFTTQAPEGESKSQNLSRFFKFSLDPKKMAIALLVVIFLGIAASFAAGQFLIKAEVKIKVNPNQHQASFSATLPDDVAAQTISGVAQGNQKAAVSGKKTIGDPARGEVSVLNWTTSPKVFSTGTPIIAKNGLKFNLDSDVEVASRSASTPGKNKVGATALEVGPNSNLPQDTEFTFVQFDEVSYSAQAETSFTGGSERESTVVTPDDLNRLEKFATETLVAAAIEDLKRKAGDKIVLDSAVEIKITRKTFDKKADEEASLLSLDMEVEAESLVFDQNELKKFIAQSANSSIDQALEARPENIEVAEIKTTKQGEALTLSGDYKVNLVPKFNQEELKAQIAAKSPKDARAIILNSPQVADIVINYSPNIPFITSIPRDPSKITFKIETN